MAALPRISTGHMQAEATTATSMRSLGLWLGLVGIDQLTGQARLSFGIPQLLDGIEVTTLAVGLFAIGEAILIASQHRGGQSKPIAVKGSVWMSREDWARSWKPWLRGAAIGFPIGGLPAGGAEVPTFLLSLIHI